MKEKTICPRCHRLRSIRPSERFCDGCLELRRQQEAPKKPKSPPEQRKE